MQSKHLMERSLPAPRGEMSKVQRGGPGNGLGA